MTAATQGLPRGRRRPDCRRLLPPPTASGRSDWHAHAARHGRLPYRDRRGDLIGDIEAAGLTGRGGAAFPVHRKLRPCSTRRASAAGPRS